MVERTMRNGKRIYTSAFKAWMVEHARVPGVSVSGLAVRHGVNANLLRHWMRLEHWGGAWARSDPVARDRHAARACRGVNSGGRRLGTD
jgi:transposase-like protein